MMAPYTPTNNSKGKKPYKSWLKDGVNGGPSSMDVLVKWLSKKTNYAKWKGNDTERIPKKSLLESIIDEMRKVGIYHRLAKDVASKISTLQANYRMTLEWKEIDGKRLMETGASEEAVHEELLKRFPYWDSLHGVFSINRSGAWPMSIRSITHTEEEKLLNVKQEELELEDQEIRKRRRLSDSHVQPTTTSQTASPTHSTQSLPTLTDNDNITTPLLVIRPLPRVLPPASHYFDSHPHHHQPNNHHFLHPHPTPPYPPTPPRDILAESLLSVTREKEAGRIKRSQEMLHFLREKRVERDQLLLEREITKRVKAKADLVKNLMDAGFDQKAIAEQLSKL
ncbi:hypothetical protein G6F56_008363 [Rhizopus delemar]|nr:hypothetical protein G6F56_008363 [Rhizopus delemar]